MSCFGNRPAPDLYDNCCNAGTFCKFNGNLDDVVSTPIYVQSVYDAILFNLQGMKTIQNQRFTPDIPPGHSVIRVVDIRCKRFFNPCNIDDPRNLKLDVDTSISGATFLQNCQGDDLKVVGPDGTLSERILFAETGECDEKCMGTPVFGTQNVSITGNVTVFIDLLLCDRCNNESVFTVCTEVNIATAEHPLVLTNFFEICMPSTVDTAFLPRFTEFSNVSCETRLATNNCGRDLTVTPDGAICGNLIVALCVSCEKKIVVPVQLCALSTGFAEIPVQSNPACTSFPPLFPNRIGEADTAENCGDPCDCKSKPDKGCKPDHGHKPGGNDCGCGCNSGCGTGNIIAGPGHGGGHGPGPDDGCGCGCGDTRPRR